jgi:flagellar biosynthesis protein FlhF
MQIKKFTGTSVQEVLKNIKAELGPDAFIISTRTLKPSGLKGMWEKPRIEVSATKDYIPGPEKGSRDMYLADEIREIKGMVSNLLSGLPIEADKDELEYHGRLVQAGMDLVTATKLSKSLAEKAKGEDPAQVLFDTISGVVDTARGLSKSAKKAAVFVGPTGVGKTTTVAKLAALLTFKEKLKVGLITIDTYKIAAVEQLKMYAEIMQIPLEVVSSPRDLAPALRRQSAMDFVLIDTPGRNHRDMEQMAELEAVYGSGGQLNTYLLLSATSSVDNLKDAIDSYCKLPVDSLVFTKLDEVACYGNIVSAAMHSGKPVSYLTTGQRVPEDIEPATSEKMATLLVNRKVA